MKLYKLTTQGDCTHNRTKWGPGVEHIASGEGSLCGPGWLHAYTDPLLAVLLNPIYGGFCRPHLWEADGDVGETDYGLKVGCTRLRTLRRMKLPRVTSEQRVRFAILCARTVFHNGDWNIWADAWLSGENRSASAATAAEAAAWAAARAAAKAAARAAWAETIDLIDLAHQAMEV